MVDGMKLLVMDPDKPGILCALQWVRTQPCTGYIELHLRCVGPQGSLGIQELAKPNRQIWSIATIPHWVRFPAYTAYTSHPSPVPPHLGLPSQAQYTCHNPSCWRSTRIQDRNACNPAHLGRSDQSNRRHKLWPQWLHSAQTVACTSGMKAHRTSTCL